MFKTLIFVILLLNILIFLLILYDINKNIQLPPILYCWLGLFSGGSIGFILIYWVDPTKDYVPFGLWFIGTFISSILGGISGVVLYSYLKKKFG